MAASYNHVERAQKFRFLILPPGNLIHLFIHLFHVYLSSAYNLPDLVSGTGDPLVNDPGQSLALMELLFQESY